MLDTLNFSIGKGNAMCKVFAGWVVPLARAWYAKFNPHNLYGVSSLSLLRLGLNVILCPRCDIDEINGNCKVIHICKSGLVRSRTSMQGTCGEGGSYYGMFYPFANVLRKHESYIYPDYLLEEGCALFYNYDLEHASLCLVIPFRPDKLTMGNYVEHVSYALDIAFTRFDRSEMKRLMRHVLGISRAESDLP
ncbi:hypothetical protein U1Q18_031901 [Sarracenia purpurea var. burkii]